MRALRARLVASFRPEWLREASDPQLADEADDLYFGRRDIELGSALRAIGATKSAIVALLEQERNALRGDHFRPVADLFR